MSESRLESSNITDKDVTDGDVTDGVEIESVLEPDTDVLFTPLHDGRATLINVHSKAQFSLNETGADIWRWLADGGSLSSVSERLKQHYDVSAAHADASVLSLARSLVAHRLCRVRPAVSSAADEDDR